MKFRGYETFYIRNGWLSKGLQKIKGNPRFFTDKNIEIGRASCRERV